MKKNNKAWLEIARQLQALGQTGLAFSQNQYDTERYQQLSEIASEIIDMHSNLEKEKLQEVFLKLPGYATPKIDVRSAVVKDGKILLVKEKQDGRWAMPGGWADIGDFPSEVAVRETKEESGFDVKPLKIVAVFDANREDRSLEFYHAFKIIFLCEFLGGEANPDHEILDVGFFDLDSLPPLSSYRTNDKHISEIKKHLEDGKRDTAFD